MRSLRGQGFWYNRHQRLGEQVYGIAQGGPEAEALLP